MNKMLQAKVKSRPTCNNHENIFNFRSVVNYLKWHDVFDKSSEGLCD